MTLNDTCTVYRQGQRIHEQFNLIQNGLLFWLLVKLLKVDWLDARPKWIFTAQGITWLLLWDYLKDITCKSWWGDGLTFDFRSNGNPENFDCVIEMCTLHIQELRRLSKEKDLLLLLMGISTFLATSTSSTPTSHDIQRLVTHKHLINEKWDGYWDIPTPWADRPLSHWSSFIVWQLTPHTILFTRHGNSISTLLVRHLFNFACCAENLLPWDESTCAADMWGWWRRLMYNLKPISVCFRFATLDIEWWNS